MQGLISIHAKPVNCQIADLGEPGAAAAAVSSLCISSVHAGCWSGCL